MGKVKIATISMLIALAASCIGRHSLANTQTSSQLRVGLYNLKPMAQMVDGRHEGVLVDLITQTAKSINPEIQLTFVLASKARLRHELLSGHLDAVYLNEADFHENHLRTDQARPLTLVTSTSVFLWSKQQQPINDLNQLAQLAIAMPSGYRDFPALAGSHKIITTRPELLPRMLMAGRVDAIINAEVLFLHNIDKLGFKAQDFHRLLLKKNDLYLWTNPSSTINSDFERWSRVAKKVHSGPALMQAWKKHRSGVQPLPQAELPIHSPQQSASLGSARP